MEDGLTFGDLLVPRVYAKDNATVMVLCTTEASSLVDVICLDEGRTLWRFGMTGKISLNDWRKRDARTGSSTDKTM